MKCKYCGKEIDEGSVFCGYCGKQQPKVKYCVQCGHEIDIDDMFCGYCGASQELNVEQKSMDMDSKQSNISEEHDSNQKGQSLIIESTESANSPKADANVVVSSIENSLESDNVEIANTQEIDPNKIDIPQNQEDLSNEPEDIYIQNEDNSDEQFSINKNNLILMICIPLLLILFIGGYVYYSREKKARLPIDSDEKMEVITSVASTDEESKTESVLSHEENNEDCLFTFDKAYEMLNPQKIHSEKAVEDYFESINLPKVMAERYIWDEDWGGDSPAVHYCWGNGIQFKGYTLLPTTNDYFGIEFILFMGIKKGNIPRFCIISSSKKWYDKFKKDAKEKGLSSGSLGNLYLNDTSSDGKYVIEIGYSNENEDV